MYHSFIVTLLLLLLFLWVSLIHLSDSLNPTSGECSTLLVLVNKKQKQQRFHTSVQKQTKKIKKLLLHWLDFPSREISTATTFLRPTAIGRSRPRVGEPGPRAMGTQPPGKSLCSPKSTSYMFYREKQKRYSFTGKIHNPKLRKC